jgi:RNase H-fold protein (predicted Holliday junction resolvase)
VNLAPFHPALAARVSEALASLLVENSAREVGRWLGIKGDTVSARGRAVAAWPITDLGVIAQRFEPVAIALRAYTTGTTEIQGDAAATVGDLLRDVAASGAFIQHATEALADGRLTEQEAADLLLELGKRRQLEERELIPALTACIRAG